MNGKKRYSSPLLAKKPRGMVLIIALWSLFFLGALALAIAAYVRPQLELAGRIKNSTTVRFLAEAGVKRAIAQIDKAQGSNVDTLKEFTPSASFDFMSQGLADGSFNYELVDEERKININTAPLKDLERLFEIVAQVNSQQAEDIAAAILDWRQSGENTRKNGAKSNYYQTLSPSYPCKDGPFEVLEEILLVKGITIDIFKSIQDEITIYGAGSVNINTADKPVLETLGMSDTLADKIISFRNGNDGVPATNDDNIFTDQGNIVKALQSVQKLTQQDINQLTNLIGEGMFVVQSDNFKGKSYGKTSRDSMTVDFVFARGGSIKFWREE